MCPSEVYELATSQDGFGPESEVFAAEMDHPCSIAISDPHVSSEDVRIQVQRNDNNWQDYEEGALIIGSRVRCRLAHVGTNHRKVTIKVFYT